MTLIKGARGEDCPEGDISRQGFAFLKEGFPRMFSSDDIVLSH